MNTPQRGRIASLAELETIYGPKLRFARKESDYLRPEFREYILKAPFMVLATSGPEGLAASAKGDAEGFVKAPDEKTILIPDRGANGRNDSLRNIVLDPRVALTFLIPGNPEMVRVSGNAHISVARDLLALFEAEGKPARTVIVVEVREAFQQCSRAIQKSGLWAARLAV